MKRKAQNLYMICVSPVNYLLVVIHVKQTDPHYMLAAPIQCKILPLAIQNKALASLATCFGVPEDSQDSSFVQVSLAFFSYVQSLNRH